MTGRDCYLLTIIELQLSAKDAATILAWVLRPQRESMGQSVFELLNVRNFSHSPKIETWIH